MSEAPERSKVVQEESKRAGRAQDRGMSGRRLGTTQGEVQAVSS
jgi:hypothetical protein